MSPRLRFAIPAVVFAIAASISLAAWSAGGPSRAQLAEARVDAASKAFVAYEAAHRSGTAPADSVYAWSVRWLDAQGGVKAGPGPADEHLKRMQGLEGAVKSKVQAGMAGQADAAAAAYYRAEAELWAADARGAKP